MVAEAVEVVAEEELVVVVDVVGAAETEIGFALIQGEFCLFRICSSSVLSSRVFFLVIFGVNV